MTREKDPAVARRRNEVVRLAKSMTVPQIARFLGLPQHIIRADCRNMGVKAPTTYSKGDQAAKRKCRIAKDKAEAVKDRRRFKIVPVPMGTYSAEAPADATGTVFPTRVFPVGDENVLKDGANSAKIGGDVMVGHLKGALIVTLTLEERATCPRSCSHWRGCYGNRMQHARRWQPGQALEDALRREVAQLTAAHDKVLVRLHILGDFYSVDYADLWAELLQMHPNLHVFGFTAHRPKSEIGNYLIMVREAAGMRFAIRHSGQTGPWGSFTIDFPTELRTLGDATVCPEQQDAMNGSPKGIHCGGCGLCWAVDTPVVFVVH